MAWVHSLVGELVTQVTRCNQKQKKVKRKSQWKVKKEEEVLNHSGLKEEKGSGWGREGDVGCGNASKIGLCPHLWSQLTQTGDRCPHPPAPRP